MPPAEDNRQSNHSGQPFRTQIVEPLDATSHRTTDFDLFATIKSGTAQVETLKLLIPGFEIIEELGRGAYGVVYRARDEKLDRQVAIKVSLLDDPERREEYIKEARHAAKLDRPGIVPVFQVGTLAGGQPFVVQRLIDGKTLRKSLAEAERLDAHHACWLISEIAGVVADAHALGMIHRDIKPDNILLDAEGKPWVADFGLAIFEEEQKNVAGQRAGTPLYMSPEQLSGRAEWLDGRTDIYAMGVMLYEMLTGRLPFEAHSLRELELQVLHRAAKPITQRAPHLPAAVDVIFNNCCAKKVDDRYANAIELAEDLRLLMEQLPQSDPAGFFPGLALGAVGSGGAQASASRRSSPSRISERRKTLRQSDALQETIAIPAPTQARHRWVLPAVAMGSVLAIAAGLMIFGPAKRSKQTKPLDHSLSQAGTPLNTGASDVSRSASEIIGGPADSHSSEELAHDTLQSKPVPQRPLRVSKAGDGTHTTIAAALEIAEVDEMITILPGTYVEQLKPVHSVHLKGEGNRDEIEIMGNDASPIVIDGPQSVQLTNLTIGGNKTNQKNFDTIEVLKGSTLVLQSCNVYSRSWDCVKLYPGSGIRAQDCGFRTSAHPAIHAQETIELQLLDCEFDIRPQSLETPSIPVGLQANNCAGLVQGCKFTGSGAAIGVHWKDSTQPIVIENCSFENCDIGILLQLCRGIRVGNTTSRVRCNGCSNGLLLEDCEAVVHGCDIEGAGGKQGISVINAGELAERATVTLSDCSLSGYYVGLNVSHAPVAANQLQIRRSVYAGVQLGKQAQLELVQSSIASSELVGLLIQDATARLDECELTQNSQAAVWVEAGPEALRTKNCTVAQNLIGAVVASGTIRFEAGAILENDLGMMIASHEQLRHTPPKDVSPIVVELQGASFRDNAKGNLTVRTPCSVQIKVGANAADSDIVIAQIVGDLVRKQQGELTVYSNAP